MRRCHRPSHHTFFASALLLGVFLLISQAATAADSPARYIAAQGRVVPAQGVVTPGVYAETGTPLLTQVHIKEGDTVKQGEALATLATQPMLEASFREMLQRETAMHDEAAAAQKRAEAAAIRAQTAEAETKLAEQGVAEAEAAADTARKTLIEAGAATEAQQMRLSGTWAENQRILDKDSPPAREAAQLRFEQKMLDLQKQELADTAAAAELRLQAQVKQAETAVISAQLRVALAAQQAQLARAEAEAAALSAKAANAEAATGAYAATRAKQLLEAATLRSPVSGTVLSVNATGGEVIPQQGLAQIADLSNLCIDAEVYIDDLRHVRLGQKALVTSAAFEGTATGTVERIANEVSLPEIFNRDPAAFTDKRVVKVRIRLDGTNDAKAGAAGIASLPAPLPLNASVLVRIER